MPPDIPAAKRAGLPVDLDRLAAEGDGWLTPEERYALKMHGVCVQAQPGVCMVRIRTSGTVDVDTARGLADLADKYSGGWLHLTTRQQVEFHHVPARQVPSAIEEIRTIGLTTRSTCGHTMRGVTSCPDAGVGLEEPFDCYPDAKATADSILARTPKLDTQMPQRINIAFGGCPSCRDHSRINDLSFVSVVAPDGALGYEVWMGGSLGKTSPTLSFQALDFIPRADVLAAANALFDVFTEHGDADDPRKGRLKFLIRRLGEDGVLQLFLDAFASRKQEAWPAPHPVSTPLSASLAEILARSPEGGWGSGVRPQRIPGRAMVTVNVPLGDVDSDDWRAVAALADEVGDEHLYLTRNQNVMLRHVPVAAVSAIRSVLARLGLGLEGTDQARDVRTCTGGPVCSLALTPSQRLGAELLAHPALIRNTGLRVHISGCPNSCAQHQIADIGFSGSKVTIAGVGMLGYQVWLGGDLRTGHVGEIVGRVSHGDVPAIISAIAGMWEALRERGETLTDTVHRFGLEACQAQIDAVFHGRWEPGPEPAEASPPNVVSLLGLDHRIPAVVGA
ncbi:MAG TPA: nitrite/sulfite reductase [Actinomycetota bacterium]|nr:nitrite/sulfite reductase [Actinomycetota bacterium]